MKDIIQLMPDHLANQIAAGEVVQRPASVVKELMENALDAGATDIQLIVKDAGKELIQVVDNGCGMSPMDARMSFERHATSKIRNIDDLFAIHTMGFRGEALAAIAAVAQVELKTRREEDELGTLLNIEASEVKRQEPVSCPKGTNFAIRNLFYNVPARRKFLKSNTSEYKHIVEEFIRVAMAFPDINFKLFHNQAEQFVLRAGGLKSRILDLLGNRLEKSLIPVSENTELLTIEGFVGKPSTATRSRSNQFFFVNSRFIRSAYLNHAVRSAYEDLIEKDAYPLYALRLTLNADRVDVNVHPSKQEVKFDDEQMLYAYMQSAVRHALAKFNVAPSLDFTLDPTIQNTDAVRLPFSDEAKSQVQSGFLARDFSEKGRAHLISSRRERQDWEQQRAGFFTDWSVPKVRPESVSALSSTDPPDIFSDSPLAKNENPGMTLCWGAYLLTTVKSGFMLIHRLRAKERILFESLQSRMQQEKPLAQQLLFPFEMELPPAELVLVHEALPFLISIGFVLSVEGQHKLVVSGLPPNVSESGGRQVLSVLIEQIQVNPQSLKDPLKKMLLEKMARSMAQSSDANALNDDSLIDELFACNEPQQSLSGQRNFIILTAEKLNSLLGIR
ncbi:MAG TPA: DNA mismatch repair endonuclease MutL [Edaphocola sp.]|nr:DNA mismatch repair endonuclease MutL [Edaphocola sp.]